MAPCPASLLLTHSQATRPLPETYSPTLTHMALVGLHAQNMLQFVISQVGGWLSRLAGWAIKGLL